MRRDSRGPDVRIGKRPDTIAYDNNTGITNQDNGNFSLGLEFDVNSSIKITALGAFFAADLNNLTFYNGNGVTVGIFDRATGLLVGSSVTINPTNYTSIVNSDAFIHLSSAIVLPSGFQGVVVAVDDRDYNQGYIDNVFNPTSTMNSGGGKIPSSAAVASATGSALARAVLCIRPTIDSGPENRYDAGTFEFAAVPLPPAAYAGLVTLAGIAGFGLVRRRAHRD